MKEDELKFIASQLRKPSGEFAATIAYKMKMGNKLINETAIETLAICPNDKVLEIGMANGVYVPSILSKDASIQYVGLDFSEEMVEAANKENKEWVELGRAQFVLANTNNLPFADNSFDKAFTVNTLYFWEDIKKTLEELKRVIKPNGLLVIAIRPKRSLELYPFVKYGFNKFSKEELESIVHQNKLTLVHFVEKEEPEQEVFGNKVKAECLVALIRITK